ncbi:esterase-like activity of phytase family protein [Rhodospirillaceae bacterium SYSU D60014]|uniref:esterase-like activity of phytase family protein n=1 Tax=Virgifigura deserti TaxID=2268457 RepID=UPI000E673D73
MTRNAPDRRSAQLLSRSAIRCAFLAWLFLFPTANAAAAPVEIDAQSIPLNPREPDQSKVDWIDYLAGFELRSDAEDWGGLSSMRLTADGSRLLALSDLGFWITFTLHHDMDGRLTGVSDGVIAPLLDEKGHPLAGKRRADAEGLARDTDGSLLVAFERDHRIWRYGPADDPFQAAAKPVEPPDTITNLPGNGGIEAMAVLGPGRILLLSEDGADAAGDIRGWISAANGWAEISLARTGRFKPTDLALLPDGDVLLLERRYSPIGGPAARLSILSATEIRPGIRLTGQPIAELTLPLSVDNFEALAAAPAPGGGTLIYLLSDDNRSMLQRTLLLQFLLRP